MNALVLRARHRIRDLLPKAVRPAARRAFQRIQASAVLTGATRRRLMRESASDSLHRRLLERVDLTISPSDTMFVASMGSAQYIRVGLDAVRCIDAVLAQSGTRPTRILDLPSGWGRVTRFLAARFPDAELAAGDLVYDGPRFCARHFGAHPVRSSADLDDLVLPGPFDLIWVGSLVTHLRPDDISGLLRLVARSLTPGGTVVVTTHGDANVSRLRVRRPIDQYVADEAPAAIESYERSGFGYVAYAVRPSVDPEEDAALQTTGYGIAYTSPDWVEARAREAGLRRICFREQDWDRHQDVHGFELATRS
jgi:SAM-dependent methyltransferase